MDEAKRKVIEKAVVDNNGELPSWVAAIRSGEHTIMRDEFYQVKAEMQNKPSWSDAPEWAEWLCQNHLGGWSWLDGKPKTDLEYLALGEANTSKCTPTNGKVIGDWRNTLERRPAKIKSVTQNRDGTFIADEDLQAGDMVSVGLLCKPSFGVAIDASNLIKKQPMKYQYGVEYECDGVKPDLPDDVLVDAYGLYSQEWHNKEKPVSDWPWDNFEKFRIVDERYKPNLDEISEREPTPELRELMRRDHKKASSQPFVNNLFMGGHLKATSPYNIITGEIKSNHDNWHDRGELPPVGEKVEYEDPIQQKWVEAYIVAHHLRGDEAIFTKESFEYGKLLYGTPHNFRPLRTKYDELVAAAEAAIETETGEPANSRHIGVLVKLGWRPPKN